jgi:multicomponent Na+:H+ antiporter subunit G
MSAFDLASGVLVLCGSALALTAAIGVVRFPDTLSRMHSATKPQVLGLLLVLSGAAMRLRGNVDVGMLILTGLFTLITAPVVAQRVGQLAYREQNVSLGNEASGLPGLPDIPGIPEEGDRGEIR